MDSIPWVRCASGNVLFVCLFVSKPWDSWLPLLSAALPPAPISSSSSSCTNFYKADSVCFFAPPSLCCGATPKNQKNQTWIVWGRTFLFHVVCVFFGCIDGWIVGQTEAFFVFLYVCVSVFSVFFVFLYFLFVCLSGALMVGGRVPGGEQTRVE